MFDWLDLVEANHSLREEAALQSGGMAADTSVAPAWWQQSERAGVGAVVKYLFGPAQVLMMFCVALMTRCRILLSKAVHIPCQFVTFLVRMLSIAPL